MGTVQQKGVNIVMYRTLDNNLASRTIAALCSNIYGQRVGFAQDQRLQRDFKAALKSTNEFKFTNVRCVPAIKCCAVQTITKGLCCTVRKKQPLVYLLTQKFHKSVCSVLIVVYRKPYGNSDKTFWCPKFRCLCRLNCVNVW